MGWQVSCNDFISVSKQAYVIFPCGLHPILLNGREKCPNFASVYNWRLHAHSNCHEEENRLFCRFNLSTLRSDLIQYDRSSSRTSSRNLYEIFQKKKSLNSFLKIFQILDFTVPDCLVFRPHLIC